MFEKILIANRGEIALRVARACRELGVPCVAVYSTADAESAVVKFADEAVHIGPPAPARSYNHIPSIIGAALKSGADAIHPGYGFLSEDPYFAEICADEGITFIGPRPDVMEKVGNKAIARDLMTQAGLPLLPGTIEPVNTADEAQDIADSIGYPVIIKAAAGGGGRGMTVVERREDLRNAYQTTRASAQAIFKDSAVYIERYLKTSRHTEIQILCDGHGNGIHLGERDCSVQRRHQKLIEEAPSVQVTPELRADMGAAAVRGALAVGYSGAGTMEFLLDEEGNYTFMEMNARIQVEHPVSEAITNIDLIREQILVATGTPLPFTQDEVQFSGHAIECRINAEDPDRGFAPTPGKLDVYVPPGGPWTRVDSHCYPGWQVSPHYDSLIAKLIVWAPDRPQAIERMDRALGEFQIAGGGLKTTIGFHRRVMANPVFQSGHFATDFIERHMAQ
ncbi:MAG TPA: acetyl-CoA carboxylase biotin carboxylase subunit [Acidimicrobiales bacterium]|nr:acetyl-CoA carboxylase biotin carboxylase subunit [Acidimicrobiales bacterium]